MNKKNRVSVAIMAISAAGVVALSACSSSDSDEQAAAMATSMSEMSSMTAVESGDGATATRSGSFAGLNNKQVAGTVSVSGKEITLTGFSSDEGPDLHVYLTNGTDEAAVSAGQEISVVSYDTAMQTFTLDDVDPGKYDTVVIHCDKAKAVFGSAMLS